MGGDPHPRPAPETAAAPPSAPPGHAPTKGVRRGRRIVDIGSPLKGLSFQSRIAVVALMTAVMVLLAACAMFVFEQWKIERQNLIVSQRVLASITADDVADTMARQDWTTAKRTLGSLAAGPQVRGAYLSDAQGVRVATFERPDPEGAGASLPALVADTSPVVFNGRKVGSLTVVSRPQSLNSMLPRFIAVGGALFFFAAGMALFLGRWLASRVTRPVEMLSRAMGEVARSGDFNRWVVRVEDDEFGRLTDSFNALLAQLHRNDQALKATMTQLVEARDAAEAANVLKSHFLANMSHEIRTPLNGVLAMAQIMDMGELSQPQRDRLSVISQSGEALLAILNDILDLSKIEAGKMELEVADFDIEDVAKQLSSNFEPLAAKKGLTLDVDVAPSGRGVRMGDCARLLQILNNLVANAVKFTERGGVRVSLEGEGPGGAGGLQIVVSDTGIGIPEDKLPLLFQKFSQVDGSTTRKFGGTGLGLAICRELAQLMGGQVTAESVEGQGSTFRVTLPLERIGSGRAPAPSRDAAGEAQDVTEDDGRMLRILAAEDNQTNQLVLRSVMGAIGLDLSLVNDGREAVEAWESGDFDVVLMDIQMPNMDGIEATRAIRDIEARTGRRRTPIIALSANAMTHQVKEYLGAGMDAHVPKPIEIARLHQALLAALTGGTQADAEARRAGEAA